MRLVFFRPRPRVNTCRIRLGRRNKKLKPKKLRTHPVPIWLSQVPEPMTVLPARFFLLEFSSPASRSLAFLKFMAILERRYIFQNIIFGIYVQFIHKFQHPKKVFHVADSPGSAVWERFVVLGSASLNLWIPMHRQGNQAPSV